MHKLFSAKKFKNNIRFLSSTKSCKDLNWMTRIKYDTHNIFDAMSLTTRLIGMANFKSNTQLIECLDKEIFPMIKHIIGDTDHNMFEAYKQIAAENSLKKWSHDEWLENGHILKLNKNHSLAFCAYICNPIHILFDKLPKLTDKHYIETYYIVNFNSLGILKNFDAAILSIAEELLHLTHQISRIVYIEDGIERPKYLTNLNQSFDNLTKMYQIALSRLRNENIIDQTDCLSSYWKECLSESEIDNINMALKNMSQTISKINSIVSNKFYY